ncbi:MAG TPA: peptide-methionine (S)-S-oxide reductase MsrA [Candidatus Norongarragalinales archaeon]|nr:peptide-methionine (S)-S-oxide reductase MsrA [Candidatus Norongarragalinales archaeon]
MKGKTEKATFAAGCFWHVEESFRHLKGVLIVISGYTGGKTADPSYEMVCSGETGHAEAVELEFDPKETSFKDLLKVFWKVHDPTTLNRQGFDMGEQYRSAIFFHSKEQERIAKESKEKLVKSGKKAVTQIVPASKFYPAEEYHQRYFEKHGHCALSGKIPLVC